MMRIGWSLVLIVGCLQPGWSEPEEGVDAGTTAPPPGTDAGPLAPPMGSDGGGLLPGPDAGPLPPGTDAGTTPPGTDAGTTPPGVDAGVVEPPPPPGDGPPAPCAPLSGSFNGLTATACVAEVSGPAPLVIALHGYTQSAADYLDTTEWDVLAGRYGFHVVFPQAPGDRAFYWYTNGRDRGQPDPEGIVAMIDALEATTPIDRTRVYVTGLSAGGYMAVSLLAGYPDVFAAGASFSGGPHGCSSLCASIPSAGTDVTAAFREHWSDASARKPRLMLVHGDADGVVAPGNMDQAMRQWTTALGTDTTPDNAAMGLPTELGSHPYSVYTQGGEVVVATHMLLGIGHGTPVDPGDAEHQGGHDPMPGMVQSSSFLGPHDWTNTTSFYGPYYAARFFGLAR